SCPASLASPLGNAIQCAQATSTNSNPSLCHYWLWRFDRPDEPVGPTDFWLKTEPQALADLQSANDPTVGYPNGLCEVELAVDPYFPQTIPSVDADLKGRAIHPGGRNRVFLDGHVQYLKDPRTPQ